MSAAAQPPAARSAGPVQHTNGALSFTCGCQAHNGVATLCAPHAWAAFWQLVTQAAQKAPRAALLVAMALLLAPLAARAEDQTPPTEAVEQVTPEPPANAALVAAGWCVVRTGHEEEPEAGEAEEVSGCDGGLGVALTRWGRIAPVAVVGSKTVGAGVAYITTRPGPGPVIAIAIGAVAPYDDRGIDASAVQLALGATFSFGGSH